jgi:hypothetical protein
VYRDGQGRIRREQTVLGLATLTPASDALQVVTITDPVARVAYTLDQQHRTARQLAFAAGGLAGQVGDLTTGRLGGRGVGGPVAPAVAPQAATESLGTRELEGVSVTGTRTTATLPVGVVGNDRPITITDEFWDSPKLQVRMLSRHSDPRTGVIEYKLTNVRLGEPASDLFNVPADYTVISTPSLPALPPFPGRAGGRRGPNQN